MFLLNWYREYLNIKSEYKEKQKELDYCESCESLKLQLSLANEREKELLDRIIHPPEPKVEEEKPPQILRPILPSRMSWNIKRQALESESRAAAKALRDNDAIRPTLTIKDNEPKKVLTVKDIEKELGVENG